jgi:tetratricopeptide (TPR) repeat protein
METNAIFFGGTDPGRFVPTYMIYCAKVRPDVYLITQNALADNTYMSVMRDLYGDTIWIPSQQDSNYAFQKYVEDVQAGRIPAGADVQFENGRVSVQGVQGVMMINGILCKMIFEANKARHAFYVEESYVIPWMYPYLSPHGLIMKINSEPIASLTPEMVKSDHSFWDWYTKRLMGNPKFLRDVVARKTFSKLRGALAGIYSFRRQYEEAEYAFKQAIDLYPLSPEANFRLADVYMQQRKFSEAGVLIDTFLKQDPGNTKVADFLRQIQETEKADARRRELENTFSQGKGELNAAMELADLYRKLNMDGPFQGLTMNILNDTNIPANVYLAIAKMYADSKRPELLATALQRYLARDPSNARIWVDLAAVQAVMQQNGPAMDSLRKAVEVGGEAARDVVRKDRRFDPIRETQAFKELIPPIQPNLPMNLPNLPMF